MRELGQRHIGDLGRAGCIRELLAADAALPVFDAAGSRAGRLDTVMTLRRMRFLFNHAGFGVVTAGAGVLLCAGRRAGGIRHSLPFTERVVRLGIFRANGTANSAFFPNVTQEIKSASLSRSFPYLRSTANVYRAIAVLLSSCKSLISGAFVSRPIKITLFISSSSFFCSDLLVPYESGLDSIESTKTISLPLHQTFFFTPSYNETLRG